VWIPALLGVACAGDLVVRAPADLATTAESALAGIPPLVVEVPPPRADAGPREPVGEREAGLGVHRASIYLTEGPSVVLRRLVVEELEAAGHRVADAAPDVVLEIRVLEFAVQDRARTLGWDVVASLRLALRISRTRGAEDHTELVYTAERSGRSFFLPGVRRNERILAECLEDLARLVAQREALAEALRRFAQVAPTTDRDPEAGAPPPG
jgi:hypothetical protein